MNFAFPPLFWGVFMTKFFHVVSLALVLMLSSKANALTLNAADRGWYLSHSTQGVVADPANLNYLVGWARYKSAGRGEYRNYFAFDLSGFAGTTYTSATLRLFNPDVGYLGAAFPGFCCAGEPETYQLNDVTGSASDLLSGVGGIGAFNDLGDGAVYGTHVASAADNGKFIEIALNASAIEQINRSTGGLFLLGGSVTTLARSVPTPNSETIFGFTGPDPYATQLVLGESLAVPEPSLLSLLIAMLVVLSVCLRKDSRGR